MVYGLWFMVCGVWFVIHGLWFMVYGLWFMVDGLWFMVHGLWLTNPPGQLRRDKCTALSGPLSVYGLWFRH